MTNDKVNQVLQDIAKSLTAWGHLPQRAEGSSRLPGVSQALDHALWMAQEAITLPPDKIEKKMRWLGFVQGLLWIRGGETIDELKEQNMPDDEKTQ